MAGPRSGLKIGFDARHPAQASITNAVHEPHPDKHADAPRRVSFARRGLTILALQFLAHYHGLLP